MSDHEHLTEQEHERRRRSATVQPERSQAPDMSGMSNSSMSSLLGGVNRSAPRSQGAGPLDEQVAADISHERGGGSPLDDQTKGDMESHMGVDLSGVRVHTGSRADALNRSVQAEAFTTGSDVFFASGKYQPSTTDGRRLLAHELTHVVQQSTGTGGEAGRVSHPDDAHEREASSVGDAVAESPQAAAPATADAATPQVARQAAPEDEEEVARQAASPEDEEEEVARQAAAEEETEEEVSRQAAPEDEEEEAMA